MRLSEFVAVVLTISSFVIAGVATTWGHLLIALGALGLAVLFANWRTR